MGHLTGRLEDHGDWEWGDAAMGEVPLPEHHGAGTWPRMRRRDPMPDVRPGTCDP